MAKRGRKTKAEEQGRRPRGASSPRRWVAPESLTGVGLEAWNELVEDLRAAGNLEHTHPRVVEAWAVNVAVLRAAQEVVFREGVVVVQTNGVVGQHPCCNTINQSTLRLKVLADALGLVPASAKLSNAGKAPEAGGGKWDDLLGVVG